MKRRPHVLIACLPLGTPTGEVKARHTRNGCLPEFGKVNTCGAPTDVARAALLTWAGNQIRWCWQKSGRQFGDCTSFDLEVP